ncbi:MAG: DUF4260 family protein [Lachnospiraceae bacterium]|nr:DUF4260 family protein [Lachnospiraceae bacterium]
MVKKLVFLEHLMLFLYFLYTYFSSGFSILLFIVLFFLPDAAIIFYKINDKIGSFAYNLIHTHSIPLALLIINYIFLNTLLLHSVCIIWLSHIAMDRFLGFVLKYKDFKDIHMQRI